MEPNRMSATFSVITCREFPRVPNHCVAHVPSDFFRINRPRSASIGS